MNREQDQMNLNDFNLDEINENELIQFQSPTIMNMQRAEPGWAYTE